MKIWLSGGIVAAALAFASATQAVPGRGMILFTGKSIPVIGQSGSVRIAVSGNNPYPSVPAEHMRLPGQGGALVVAIDIRATLKDKKNENTIGVQLQGREVFRSNVTRLQETYRQLERCMNGSKYSIKTASDKPATTPQQQLTMSNDELEMYYDIVPDDPQKAIKILNVRESIRNYLLQDKMLRDSPSIFFSNGRPRVNQTQMKEQRMCGHNNGQFGYLAPC